MVIHFGEFVFDSGVRRLTRQGREVALSPKAFQLLQILIEQRPNAVAKEQLIDRLWPDVIVEEANVRNLVAEIRAAIDDTKREEPMIRTIARFGYAFAVTPGPSSPAALISGTGAHLLSAGDNVIGRGQDCAVVINQVGVSRRHARIRMTEDAATIVDLASRNGTLVNGQRIDSETALKDGDTIRIGVLTLRFRQGPEVGSTTDAIQM